MTGGRVPLSVSALEVEEVRSGAERMSPEGQAQRAVGRESQQEMTCAADHAAGDAEIATPQGHHPIANGQAEATVPIENEEVAGQDLEGEVGGVGGEAI